MKKSDGWILRRFGVVFFAVVAFFSVPPLFAQELDPFISKIEPEVSQYNKITKDVIPKLQSQIDRMNSKLGAAEQMIQNLQKQLKTQEIQEERVAEDSQLFEEELAVIGALAEQVEKEEIQRAAKEAQVERDIQSATFVACVNGQAMFRNSLNQPFFVPEKYASTHDQVRLIGGCSG